MEKKLEPIYYEEPEPDSMHVLNYLQIFGAQLKTYRDTFPIKGSRSVTQFAANRISPYFKTSVTRGTVSRSEKGDHTVSMGVYSAFIFEVGIWPDIIHAAATTKEHDERYLKLVTEELKKKQVNKIKERMDCLQKQYFNMV